MSDDRRPEHDAMRHLFDEAMQTGPAHAGIDRLVYCYLLDRVTAGDTATALAAYHDPGTIEAALREFDDLDPAGRDELLDTVIPMWNHALSLAVGYMWNAARKLGYDPDGLDPKHVALLGSVLLGADFTHLADKHTA